jgi:hypothetical protein
MKRAVLKGNPAHQEGIHHILTKDHPNLATRYYMWLNNEIPHSMDFEIVVDAALFKEAIKDDPFYSTARISSKEIFGEQEGKVVRTKCLLHIEIRKDFIIYIPEYGAYVSYGDSVSDHELEEVSNKLWEVSRLRKNEEREEKSFSMIVRDEYANFELHDFSLKAEKVELGLYYNDDLLEIHPEIVGFLNDKDASGLVLLHGLPGTGKTSYLRHLIRETNAHFIYIPTNLLENINEPSFLPFISRLKGAVIILEDCEDLLRSRSTGSTNSGISVLLNLADGLLGDALRFKIICTFNADTRDLDTAIMRKGRLFCRYEFHCLTYDKTNALLDHIGYEEGSDIPLTLGNIFNYRQRNNNMEQQRRVGFQRG